MMYINKAQQLHNNRSNNTNNGLKITPKVQNMLSNIS